MGRKKRASDDAVNEEEPPTHKKAKYSDSDYSDDEPRHYDIDPDIRDFACSFGIDEGLTQKLNDIMIEKRQRTWDQDLARLNEVLKEAHTPAAMLNLKLRDMEKGSFVGKAKCAAKVRELAHRHKLDRGASTKLEDAMSMREGLGKDVEKDLMLLDEHLQASNAPSKLVSMKLDSLRKGYGIGHCIYSREPMPGNQGPGVDGVFDKRGKRVLGYTDADLGKRFAENDGSSGSGQLMDEATVMRMMKAERKHFDTQQEEPRSRSRSRKRKTKRSPSRGQGGSRSRGNSHKRKHCRSRSSPPASPKRKKSRSRSSPDWAGRKAKRQKSKSRSRHKSCSKAQGGSPGRSSSSSSHPARTKGKKKP